MDKLKQLDSDTLSINNGLDVNQHDDIDHDYDNMVDLPHVKGVLEGEPSAIQDDSFDSNKDITRTYHSTPKSGCCKSPITTSRHSNGGQEKTI